MPDFPGDRFDGCHHLRCGRCDRRVLQFHTGLKLVNAKLLAVHGDFGAFRHIGKVAKGTVCHLDEKMIAFDGNDLTVLDLDFVCGFSGCSALFGSVLARWSRPQQRDKGPRPPVPNLF